MRSELYGLLVVNNFLETKKFLSLYELLSKSAERHGMKLDIKKTGELVRVLGEDLKQRPDAVLFWDKDIMCARVLEGEGIPVFNSSSAVELCDNKALTYITLSKAGVRIPKTVICPKTFEGVGYCDTDFVYRCIDALSLPLVIKECYGSYGSQVYLAHTAEEALSIVKSVSPHEMVMQELVKTSYGRDVRVNTVGGRVICSMLRQSANGDFRSNITAGGGGVAYEADGEMCRIALAASEALGLEHAGVDILFGSDGYYVCEVNSNPDFKSTLECTGVNLADHIVENMINKLTSGGDKI